MKIKLKDGFDGYDELSKKAQSSAYEFFKDGMEAVKEYRAKWKTATIPKKDMTIESGAGYALVELKNGMVFSEKKQIPLAEGTEYIFGRKPVNHIGGELYCLSIDADGKENIENLDKFIPREISRVQIYAKDFGKEIQIIRLGLASITVKIADAKNSIVVL